MKQNNNSHLELGKPFSDPDSSYSRKVINFILKSGGVTDCRVVDVGCGFGVYEKALSVHAGTVIGIELEIWRLKQAIMFNPGVSNVNFILSNAEVLALRDGCSDVILCSEVLEHVKDESKAFKEMARILNGSGRIVITVPHKLFPFETHPIYIGRHKLTSWMPLFPWLPQRIRNHFQSARVYSVKQMEVMLDAAGFRIDMVDYCPPTFDIISNKRLASMFRQLYRVFEVKPWRKLFASHILISAIKRD